MVFSVTRPMKAPLYAVDKRKALFLARKMLPEYVFDASKLENNPLTFPEIQTLMDGITVGGHKVSDVQQVLNIRDAWNFVLNAVKLDTFKIDIETANQVNALIAREEALEWGKFRTGNVGLWMSLNQFYLDGNKRTARLMASGYLLSHGIGVFNIRARDIQEFNAKMVKFYNTKEADEIAGFLADKAIVLIERQQ